MSVYVIRGTRYCTKISYYGYYNLHSDSYTVCQLRFTLCQLRFTLRVSYGLHYVSVTVHIACCLLTVTVHIYYEQFHPELSK